MPKRKRPPLPPRGAPPSPPHEEITPEVTGSDAEVELARAGDAGSGASPHGADLTGLSGPFDHDTEPALEEDPSAAPDIAPDRIEERPER